MSETTREHLRQWYAAGDEDKECLKPAQDVFAEATAIFEAELTKDPKKRGIILLKKSTLADVEQAVKGAKERYDATKKHEKVRGNLYKFTQVVHHYGQIMEVFIQHHPEYVALAYGAMNAVFVTFINHEATISTLADGLTQIATALPRTELSLILYPTPRMKRAVAQLYAHIIKFLLRAKSWYEEHWIKHVWHSVSRPVELRFAGLINDMESLSAAVDNLAAHGSRAEQREMHQKVDVGNAELSSLRGDVREAHQKVDVGNAELTSLRGEVQEAREMIKSLMSLMSSSSINTDSSTLSHMQILDMIQAQPNMPQADPKLAYRYNLSMRNRRVTQNLSPSTYPTYTSALKAWSHASTSSLLVLQCPPSSRQLSRDLAVSTAHLLTTAGVPTLWALDSGAEDAGTHLESEDEVLRYLLKQAAALFLSDRTESAAASFKCQLGQTTSTSDLARLLAACLRSVPVVYMVVEAEAINSGTLGSSLPLALVRVLDTLDDNGWATSLKVLITRRGVDGSPDTVTASRPNLVRVSRGIDPVSQRLVGHARFPSSTRGRGRGGRAAGRRGCQRGHPACEL